MKRALEVVIVSVIVLPVSSPIEVAVKGAVAPARKGGVSSTLKSEDFHRIWMANALVISSSSSAVSVVVDSAKKELYARVLGQGVILSIPGLHQTRGHQMSV